MNWTAAPPTAGRGLGSADSDGDGLPDDWENLYELNPNDPGDAGEDPDQDGLTNLQEFRAGTAPNDSLSVLAVEAHREPDGSIRLVWNAAADRTYVVQYREALGSGAWQTLTTRESGAQTATIELPIEPSEWRRFYRLLVP